MWTFTAVTVAAIGRRSAATFTVGHNTLTATPVLELFGSALPIVGCKRLHLIRHAQGTHNLAEEKAKEEGTFPPGRSADILLEQVSGRQFLDPPLTNHGFEQCHELRRQLKGRLENLDLVVSSPSQRTLQTAYASLPQLRQGTGVPILATDRCRERVGPFMCDFRRPTDEIASQFPSVDMAGDVTEQDPFLQPGAESEDRPEGCAETETGCPQVQTRAKGFVQWVVSLPGQNIAVVSHKHFLNDLMRVLGVRTGSWQRDFANAELRSVDICAQHNEL